MMPMEHSESARSAAPPMNDIGAGIGSIGALVEAVERLALDFVVAFFVVVFRFVVIWF